MICFYHDRDFDGVCSGAIVKHFNPDCTLFGIDYGDEFPLDEVVGEDVVLVDYSLQPFVDMIFLKQDAGSLTWIDHHITAINEAKAYGERGKFQGRQEKGKAACELTWKYYSKKKIPIGVKFIGRYDVWDLDYHSDVVPFQYGMRSIENAYDPQSEIWETVLNSSVIWDIAKIITKGDSILDYEKSRNKMLMDNFAFEGSFLGHNALFINMPLISTSTFKSRYDENKHDIMIGFYRNVNGDWNVSLRSVKDNIDVGKIAKEQGGGGHKQAAGFQTKKLWFL